MESSTRTTSGTTINDSDASVLTSPEAATSGVSLDVLLDKIIFRVLLALIAFAAIFYGTVEPWWVALVQVLIFMLGGLWVVGWMRTGSGFVREHRLLIPLLALVGFAYVQTLPLLASEDASRAALPTLERVAISVDPFATNVFLLHLFALVVFGALLMRYTRTLPRLLALIHVVLGVAIASALLGLARDLFQTTGAVPILTALNPGVGYAQFINNNHFPYLMEMAIGLAFGLVVWGGVGRDRLFYYLTAGALTLIALFTADSRGAVASFFCQVLFGAFLYSIVPPLRGAARFDAGASRESRDRQQRNREMHDAPPHETRGRAEHRRGEYERSEHGRGEGVRRRRRSRAEFNQEEWAGGNAFARLLSSSIARIALAAAFVVVVAFSVLLLSGDQVTQQLETLPDEFNEETVNRGNTRRLDMWQATWQVIKDNPIVGIGFGGHGSAAARYHDASGFVRLAEVHNEYLELAVSAGLVGVALGVWFLVLFVSYARKRVRSLHPLSRAAACGALIGLIGSALHSFVDFGLHITVNALVFTTLIVIATVNIREEVE